METQFSIFSAITGEFLRGGNCPEEMLVYQAHDNELLVTSGKYSIDTHYWRDRLHEYDFVQKQLKAARPQWASAWSNETMSWIDPRGLEEAKADKRQEVNVARLQANRSTFNFMGHPISCDELSRSDIDGVNGIVTLINAMPPNWVGAWKAADNVYVPIADVPTWIGFYAALVAQGSANFAHAQELKARIDAAESAEELTTITWL